MCAGESKTQTQPQRAVEGNCPPLAQPCSCCRRSSPLTKLHHPKSRRELQTPQGPVKVRGDVLDLLLMPRRCCRNGPNPRRVPGCWVASRAGHAGRGADFSQTLSLGCDFHGMTGLNPGTAMLKHQHRLAGLPAPWAAVAGLAKGVSQLGETGSPPPISIHLQPFKSLSRCFCHSPLQPPPPLGLGPAPTSGGTLLHSASLGGRSGGHDGAWRK